MNRRTGWCAALVALAMGLWAGFSPAASLGVEALRLEPGAGWERGPAEQEQADEVFILDHRGAAGSSVQVLLLRRAPVVKGDADAYFDRLTRYWRGQYGKAVLIDWLEAGGVKWRYIRRPAGDQGMGVFQLSTVFEGRAYSLLVYVPGTLTSLPPEAQALIAGARFGAAAAEVATPPPPQVRWARARTYRFNLQGEALEAVVMADAERLGRDGMLTGYGLSYGESSVEWFLEGFEWKTVAGRVARVSWSTRGRLEVDAPAELEAGAAWTLRLILPEGEAGVNARLVVWEVCAEAGVLRTELDKLNRGARMPMERLAAACPGARPSGPDGLLKGVGGRTATANWVLPGGPAVPQAGNRMRLVEVVLEPAPERKVPGDELLAKARLFFAYEPYLPSR